MDSVQVDQRRIHARRLLRRVSLSLNGWSPWLILITAFITWVVACADARFSTMGAYGLVSVLPRTFYVSLMLIVLGVAIEVVRDAIRPFVMVSYLAVLILILFGTACAIEPIASLSVTWLHAGFTGYIFQHGHVLNNYDGRFSWPGVFSMAAMLSAFMGHTNVIGFLRWFPVVIELAYMGPVLAIARYAGVSRRAGWVAAVLFYASNWIYQDNFSPQGIDYLFYLVIVAGVLMLWRPRTMNFRHKSGVLYVFDHLRSLFSLRRIEGNDAVATNDSLTTLKVTGLLLVLAFASSMSHQLTPYATVLALLACLGARRLGSPELMVLVALLAIGWLSLGASNYWLAHLSSIFGAVGQVSSTVGSNLTQHVVGSASHRMIVNLRLLLTAFLYGLAGLGILRRRTSSRVVELLVGAPFVLLYFQNYGGEGLLRVVLFGLPFSSLLAASAIFPNGVSGLPRTNLRERGFPIAKAASVFLVVGVCASLMVVTRGGNDAYESFSPGELSAVNYVYAQPLNNAVVGLVAPYVPFNYEKVGSASFFVAAGGGTPSLSYLRYTMLYNRPTYIILTKSQETWGEEVAGYPKGWETTMGRFFLSKGYVKVASWPTATVLKIRN